MVVLVTGARSGIGRATVQAAVRAGHTVYAGVRDLSTWAPLPRAIPLQLDITSAADRDAAVARILEDHPRIDALVNNAGVAMGGFLEQLDEDELRQVFEVNVFATWAMTKAVLPSMRSARSGVVVMVSSGSGRLAWPCLGAYASSKFALEGMSEAWRVELGAFGIRVVVVEPGAYRTDIWGRNRALGRHAKDPDGPYARWVDHVDRLFARVVDRQARDPGEVGDAIVRLLAARRPKLRHPVGPDARLRAAVARFVPSRAVEALLTRVMTPPDDP